jgi:hypothetical protein
VAKRVAEEESRPQVEEARTSVVTSEALAVQPQGDSRRLKDGVRVCVGEEAQSASGANVARMCGKCGERKCHARGLCVRCYEHEPDVAAKKNERWKRKYHSNPEFAARIKATAKRHALADDGAYARILAWKDAHPEKVKQYRKRYKERISPYPMGCTVEYMFAGFPIRGQIIGKPRGCALVKFKTFEKMVPYGKLKRVEEAVGT